MLKLRCQRSDPGRGPGLAVQRQPEELRVHSEEAWAHQRGKVPLMVGVQGEGWDHRKIFPPRVCALRQQDTAYRSSRGRHELLPPLWAPEVGTGCCHHYETHEQAPSAAPTVPGVRGLQPSLRDLRAGSKPCPHCPWTAQAAAAPRRPMSRHQALPPLSRECTGHSCCYETCEQVPSAGSTILGARKGHCTCIPHIKGITASTH